MTRTITDWRNGQVIWTGEADTVKGALMAAHASRADLSGADLSWSDLSRADLSWADLSWSNLSRADLCPVTVLLSSIGQVSDDLCSDLMNYGAANCPNGVELFGVWASGGACPYAMLKVQRVANFTEDRKLWRPDRPLLSAFELMKRVLREKCANSDYHDVKESK